MATKQVVKKTVARTRAKVKPAVRKVTTTAKAKVAATPKTVKNAVLAGFDVAERMQKRVQDQTNMIYGGMVNAISRETDRFTRLRKDTAKAFAKKANLFVRKGEKIRSDAQVAAEAKAYEVIKEIKALAAKSETAFMKNVKSNLGPTMASAKDGITKLEHVFEARVAKTLNTFGIPSSQNVRELQARMAELQRALVQLNKRGVRA